MKRNAAIILPRLRVSTLGQHLPTPARPSHRYQRMHDNSRAESRVQHVGEILLVTCGRRLEECIAGSLQVTTVSYHRLSLQRLGLTPGRELGKLIEISSLEMLRSSLEGTLRQKDLALNPILILIRHHIRFNHKLALLLPLILRHLRPRLILHILLLIGRHPDNSASTCMPLSCTGVSSAGSDAAVSVSTVTARLVGPASAAGAVEGVDVVGEAVGALDHAAEGGSGETAAAFACVAALDCAVAYALAAVVEADSLCGGGGQKNGKPDGLDNLSGRGHVSLMIKRDV